MIKTYYVSIFLSPFHHSESQEVLLLLRAENQTAGVGDAGPGGHDPGRPQHARQGRGGSPSQRVRLLLAVAVGLSARVHDPLVPLD